jgi:hypothetical protein
MPAVVRAAVFRRAPCFRAVWAHVRRVQEPQEAGAGASIPAICSRDTESLASSRGVGREVALCVKAKQGSPRRNVVEFARAWQLPLRPGYPEWPARLVAEDVDE